MCPCIVDTKLFRVVFFSSSSSSSPAPAPATGASLCSFVLHESNRTSFHLSTTGLLSDYTTTIASPSPLISARSCGGGGRGVLQGMMLDVSRGRVFSVETLGRTAMVAALSGFSHILLYMVCFAASRTWTSGITRENSRQTYCKRGWGAPFKDCFNFPWGATINLLGSPALRR